MNGVVVMTIINLFLYNQAHKHNHMFQKDQMILIINWRVVIFVYLVNLHISNVVKNYVVVVQHFHQDVVYKLVHVFVVMDVEELNVLMYVMMDVV